MSGCVFTVCVYVCMYVCVHCMSVFVFAVEDQEAEEDATQEAKSSEERCWTLASGAP